MPHDEAAAVLPPEETLEEAARTIILALIADAPDGVAKRQGRKFVEYLDAQIARQSGDS